MIISIKFDVPLMDHTESHCTFFIFSLNANKYENKNRGNRLGQTCEKKSPLLNIVIVSEILGMES